MEASSSATSDQVAEAGPYDYVSYEWVGLGYGEKVELLLRKKIELVDFENEVQEYRTTHGWDESYMDRATQDLFYHIRVIDKLQAAVNVHLAAGDHRF